MCLGLCGVFVFNQFFVHLDRALPRVMASEGIKPRTILEYVTILGVIYLFFGGQLSGVFQSQPADQNDEILPISPEKSESLVYPDPALKCRHHPYNVHIFSSSPLIIYIESFLSEEESQHMIEARYA